MSSYHQWRPAPPPKQVGRGKPPASAGPAPLAARDAAIEDALSAEKRERIKAEAREAAAEALAAWDKRRGRT